ncbi:MAG: hypothetical protein U9R27_09705, partial [Campylobacterota bacterium]|nr:hypothetical protein [Campylobacterota bacterium]
MKHLRSIFTLPLSLYLFVILALHRGLKRYSLALLLSAVLTPLSLQAASNTCPGVNYDVPLGTSSIIELSANSDFNYHQLSIPSDGNITITFTNDSNKASTFYVGSACAAISDIYDGNTTAVTHSVPKFAVIEGQTIQLLVDDTGNNEDYNITIVYDAPIILASIAPAAVTIPEGFTSVDLDVTLNRGAINGDLNVTYHNSYDNSTNYFLIDKWYDEYTLTIDINTTDQLDGDDFNITLISAIDTSGSDTGIITDDNTSTITIGPPEADLYIVKKDDRDPVKINTSFYYTIAVTNLGTADSSDINVTDSLPSAFRVNQDIDFTKTNNESTDWNCSISSVPNNKIVCLHDGNISAGNNALIKIHINVPDDNSTIGTVTNIAEVVSAHDYDIRNNSTTETTKIVAVDYDEINEITEICYSDTTATTMNSIDFKKNCVLSGNFYSGNGCTATVDINASSILTHNIDINLTKMYAPEIVHGTCSVDMDGTGVGSCSGYEDIDIEVSPSYTKGYTYTITASDGNFTITDVDSYDGNPNNPADIDAIGLYATYNYQGVYHYGRVTDCGGNKESGVEMPSSADAIDTPIGADATYAGYYNNSIGNGYDLSVPPVNQIKFIQTMATYTSRDITGVYLDIETKETIPYDFNGTKDASDFVIIPYLVDEEYGTCGENARHLTDDTGDELIISIPEGSYSATVAIRVPKDVRQTARLQLIIIDPNTLSPEGQKCLANSSTGGNLEGIGQCGNSEIQYVDGFGVDAWDRCSLNNGQPCLSAHGGYSGGGDDSYPGYNALYDNALGCYMCTFDIQPACSTDNFAIRPHRFDESSMLQHDHAPNLLRAGMDYNISLTALHEDNTTSTGYTVTDTNFLTYLDSDVTKFYKDGTEENASEPLHGTITNDTSEPAYAVGGYSSLYATGPATAGTADGIMWVSYSDVGKVELHIYDKKWAEVDDDDTPTDCNSTTHTYICGDKNVTFIPHHFEFAELNITNHDGPTNNFTYIADERDDMSAKIQTLIKAVNEDNETTENFRRGDLFYENNISVTPIILYEYNTTVNPTTSLESNESNITDLLIGFGDGANSDENGTRTI